MERIRILTVKIMMFCILIGSCLGMMAVFVQAEEDIPGVIFENSRNEAPDLYIKKQVKTAMEGYDPPEDQEFSFVLKLDGELAKRLEYRVFDKEDEEIFDDISPSVTAIPTLSPLSDEERYADGKHFKIELSDGSDEWLTINEKRAKNTYDFTKLVNNDGRLKYEMDGNKTSFIGIDVSRYQADIDFKLVKADGIDFVMIKVGSRGYQTGKLTLDEYFEKNITAAKEAGLDVGVYFSSQAVSIQEAAEEANVVIQALNGRLLEYPVAFDMELVPNDTCRIQNLTKEERSLITATFINTMAAAGYKTICYGNEEWLCKKIDLTNLPSVSVWLSDDDEMPDYPYQYVMWQYSKQGAVKGINGEVNMDICFIDYAAQ